MPDAYGPGDVPTDLPAPLPDGTRNWYPQPIPQWVGPYRLGDRLSVIYGPGLIAEGFVKSITYGGMSILPPHAEPGTPEQWITARSVHALAKVTEHGPCPCGANHGDESQSMEELSKQYREGF